MIKQEFTWGGNVSGVLLYAKTDEDITPDNDYLNGWQSDKC